MMHQGRTTRHENGKLTRTYVRLDAEERRKIDAWDFERHIGDSARLRALIFKGLACESTGRAAR
jgi:hypothetical protein